MNTHQKVFFTCAVSLGLVAAALAATPTPSQMAAPIELPRATVIGHRVTAPEITLERTVVIGHRSDAMVASKNSKTGSVG